MSRAWLEQRERGSAALIRFIIWIALRIGRPVGRLLLYPICAYFLLFSVRTRRASREYWRRIGGENATLRTLFRHYHVFAATILDRVFLLSGRHDIFEVEMHGVERFHELVQRGQGCLLLSAHVGSFEMLRVLGMLGRRLPLHILFYEENSRKMSALLHALNPAVAASVIPVGSPGTMLKVHESLAAGHLVGVMGDRCISGEKQVRCRFLGEEAAFPAGPLLMAKALQAPVVLCFGLYRGDRRYDVHFEVLAERVEIRREAREQDLQAWVQRYAERLEHYCRAAPYNWFNFYDFWKKGEPHA